MNIFNRITKLSDNTFESLCASLVWVGAVRFISNYPTLTAAEKKEYLTLCGLSSLITIPAIQPNVNDILALLKSENPPIELTEAQMTRAEERLAKTGRSMDSFQEQIEDANIRQEQRHQELLTIINLHGDKIRSEITKAMGTKPTLATLGKLSEDTQEIAEAKVIDKLDTRYNKLVLTQSRTKNEKIIASIDKELDKIDVFFATQAA